MVGHLAECRLKKESAGRFAIHPPIEKSRSWSAIFCDDVRSATITQTKPPSKAVQTAYLLLSTISNFERADTRCYALQKARIIVSYRPHQHVHRVITGHESIVNPPDS